MADNSRGARVATWACVIVAAMAILAPGCDRVDEHGVGRVQAIEGASVIGSSGATAGRFFTPRAIANDGKYLWVVDRTARVQRIDPATGACVQWWRMPAWELGKPTGMTIAASPRGGGERAVYVADTHYHRVMVYALPKEPVSGMTNPEEPIVPELIKELGTYGSGAGEFVYPCGVAVVPRADGKGIERLYVAEFGGNDRVQIFDGYLKPIGSFGKLGGGEDEKSLEFSRPQTVVIDEKHKELLIADSVNHRLGRFTMDGGLLGWIGSPGRVGSAPGELRHPRGLQMLEDGSVLVVEFGNNRVQRLELPSGRSLGTWGAPGSRVGELAEPWGVTKLGSRVYVVEGRNNRVTGFELK